MNPNQNDQFVDVTRITPSRFHTRFTFTHYFPPPLFLPDFSFPTRSQHTFLSSHPPLLRRVPSPVAIAWHKRHPRIRAFVALLKVLSTPSRVSLCFTLELSDNKRETGAREREIETEREDRGGQKRGWPSNREEGREESIIYTAASCRPDYFNFFLSFPPPSSLFLPSQPSSNYRRPRKSSFVEAATAFSSAPPSPLLLISSFLRLNVCDHW